MLPESPFYQNSLQTLQQSPLCQGVNTRTLEDMMQLFTRRRWSKGTRISEQQSRNYFHIILQGRLKLTRMHQKSGRAFTLWLLGPGDGYDIVSLLDGREHDILPVVLDDVEALTTHVDNVRAWIAGHPDFNRCFLPYIGEQMRQLENLSTDLALHDTVTRLARLILHYVDMTKSSSSTNNFRVQLINDFSHETLACMVGSVRTVINRHLQQLKKDGVVDFHRGHLTVKDLERLALQAGQYLHTIEHQQPK